MHKFIIFLFSLNFLLSQSTNDEFRATWVITWEHMAAPASEGKANIRQIMDDHVAANMNAVLFQARQSGTAYYNSSFEPWGYYANNGYPGYDPLEYAVQEAHKRGLELHAWFNVFQASSTVTGAPAAEHPEWVCRDMDNISMDSYRALSPGLDAVKDYTLNVAMELVNNYDIDGLHLDYIRWNEHSNDGRSLPTVQEEVSALDGMISDDQMDALSRNRSGRYLYDVNHKYSDGVPAGYGSWEEWWRNSVTDFVIMLHDSIQAVKPYVRLSTAVLGKYNWSGWQGYGTVFQDGALWYNNGYVDQLTPMHYHWQTGSEFLGMLVNDCPNCWSDYIQDGIADDRIYSVGPPSYLMSWNNHADVVEDCRTINWVKGFQFFSYGSWDYFDGWEAARNTFFSKKTKLPESYSTLSVQANAPSLTGSQIDDLHYQFSVTPSDSSNATWFVVYRSESETVNSNTDEIIYIGFTDSTFFVADSFDGTQDFNGQYHYYATQVNRFWKESPPSNIFLSDSIPSFAPVVINTIPGNLDTVDVNISPIIHFSKTMITQDVYSLITLTPDPGHNLVWSNSNKTVTINVWYNLAYNTTYTIDLSSELADVNGIILDGNSDGIPGDGYSFEFQTFDQDVLGPIITETSFSIYNPVDIGQVLTVTFDEEVNSSSLNSNTVLLFKNNNTVSYDDALSTFNEEFTSYTIRPMDGFLDNSTYYELHLTDGVTDIIGNPMQAVSFGFISESFEYNEIELIDEFDNTANWWDPSGSGSTIGILAGTSFGVDNTISIPGTYPRRSAKLSYVWDTSASEHLIRTYLSGGDPRAVEFDTSYTLESYIYGDGSHNFFRFALDDHLPATAGSYHEVSEWIEIDWIGWKLITWDLGSDPVGSWIGNRILEGTLRTDSFQMTYNTDYGVAEGAIYFDDYRITKKTFSLSVENDQPVLPETITLYQNYPNPFNPSTNIFFDLPYEGNISITIYDLLGRKVRSLINKSYPAGHHKISWNGTNDLGNRVSTGMYFCQLKTESDIKTIRMIFNK